MRASILIFVWISFLKQNDMIFGEKNFVGSRIWTLRTQISPAGGTPFPQFARTPKSCPLGARGSLGSGALDHSAIPTHVDLQILQVAYLANTLK